MRRVAALAATLAATVAALALCACGRAPDEGAVVVYVSADEQIARPVLAAFTEATGIRVEPKFDTEATKTTGLASVLRAEAQSGRPRADVFWSSEAFMTAQLAEEGVLAPHRSEAADAWPTAFRDAQGRWFGFGARGRVIVYAPERVKPHEVPKHWSDLTRDWWKGRIVMADPRFGTTRGHLGAMKAYWDAEVMPGYFASFIDGLADNEIRLLTSGNAGVVEAIVAGEADAGMTDTDDVWAAQARGANLAWAYPRHNVEASAADGGTLLVPNTVARVAGGPNEAAAARFIDFMLSPQVERMLLESTSHNVPVLPERLPDAVQALAERCLVPDPLRVDYAAAARKMDEAVELAMDRLGR